MSWGKTKALFEYSQFWDDKTGCAFIPWGSVTEEQLIPLLETCILDEDTLPPGMSIPSASDKGKKFEMTVHFALSLESPFYPFFHQ